MIQFLIFKIVYIKYSVLLLNDHIWKCEEFKNTPPLFGLVLSQLKLITEFQPLCC